MRAATTIASAGAKTDLAGQWLGRCMENRVHSVIGSVRAQAQRPGVFAVADGVG